MKPNNIGTCTFRNIKKELTVGDSFELHCEWPPSLILHPPLSIPIDGYSHALVILDILSLNPGKGSFKVTSYQPGMYHSNFKIISNKDTVHFSHPGWKVTSMIPPQKAHTLQPYPPYGPWKEHLPGWYWLSGIFCIALLITWMIYKWNQFTKRKTFLQKTQDRMKGQNSFHIFISQVTLLNRQINSLSSHQIIHNLKTYWQCFLENELLIPIEGQKLKQVTKYIKHYHPVLYQKHISTIQKLWVELESSLLSSDKLSDRDCEQLLILSRQVSVTIHQRGTY